jgi:Helix-turn-helix domain
MQITDIGRRRNRVLRVNQSSLNERLGYSPAEFAALFGRSPTWGYRQIYSARIKPICDCGRLLIPRSEVDSFLARKAEYNPVTIGGGE